jgi:hypothetical protein
MVRYVQQGGACEWVSSMHNRRSVSSSSGPGRGRMKTNQQELLKRLCAGVQPKVLPTSTSTDTLAPDSFDHPQK